MIEIESNLLSEKLKILNGVCKKKTSIPVTAYVLMETSDSGLKLSATNLDVSVKASVDCSISKDMSALVECDKLFRLVQSCAGSIVIKQQKNSITVSYGKSSHKFSTLPVENFPTVNFLSEFSVDLSGKVLRNMIKKTSHLAVPNPVRAMLEGVLMEFSKTGLMFCGSDGFRLSRVDFTGDYKLLNDFKVTCPRELLPFFSLISSGSSVKLGFDGKSFGFYSDNILVCGPPVSAQYPDVSRLFSDRGDLFIEINRTAVMSAIARNSIFSDPKSLINKFTIRHKDVTMVSADEESESEEVIDVISSNLEHEKLYTVSFKLDQLLNGVEAAESETVFLYFSEKLDRFRVCEPESSQKTFSYAYLMSPLRES